MRSQVTATPSFLPVGQELADWLLSETASRRALGNGSLGLQTREVTYTRPKEAENYAMPRNRYRPLNARGEI